MARSADQRSPVSFDPLRVAAICVGSGAKNSYKKQQKQENNTYYG
jgi:hypothetical protein